MQNTTDDKALEQVQAGSTDQDDTEIKVEVQKPCNGKAGSRSLPAYVDPM
jgi:hypothetical protein